MIRVFSFILLAPAIFAQRKLFINPAGLPALPSQSQAVTAAADAGLAIDDIQGDILVGMLKNKELFLFFNISDVASFKTHLAGDLHPLLTSVTQVLSSTTSANTMINIAFSQKGLDVLGIADSLGDTIFRNGQAADAPNLGDPGATGTEGWQPEFKAGMHGIMLFASNEVSSVTDEASSVLSIFGDSITEVYRLLGEARPDSEEGHEHFGFKDGIGQPSINGFNDLQVFPGQTTIDAGHILLGETGDATTRPEWAKDGSFLVFRQLKQLVPEFNKYLLDNALATANGRNLTQQEGADLLGARMVGRWKSGAPIDVTPFADDKTLGDDAQRNNFFNYSDAQDGSRCPFSAHIRKTNPRTDFNPENVKNHIVRASIPYGPEVSPDETANNTSGDVERGLAFVSYQSDISIGFRFLQATWANNANFRKAGTGIDAIIGANKGQSRAATGFDPDNLTRSFSMPTDFVVSRGGEYFFAPSLSAILNTLAV